MIMEDMKGILSCHRISFEFGGSMLEVGFRILRRNRLLKRRSCERKRNPCKRFWLRIFGCLVFLNRNKINTIGEWMCVNRCICM
jgi:hypothetical protein